MNEVNENVTVNGAGTQDEEPAAKNNETKAEKRYQLYGAKASKLADKSQKNTGKGERK